MASAEPVGVPDAPDGAKFWPSGKETIFAFSHSFIIAISFSVSFFFIQLSFSFFINCSASALSTLTAILDTLHLPSVLLSFYDVLIRHIARVKRYNKNLYDNDI